MLDLLMLPFMFVLGGFRRDSIQETHPWQPLDILPKQVNPNLAITVIGNRHTTTEPFLSAGKPFRTVQFVLLVSFVAPFATPRVMLY